MDDLIQRYAAAVGRQLPTKQGADIQAEIVEELTSRVEEREALLGRPLSRADLEGLLIEFGNPLVVAGRYRKTQMLIGPEVFPFWWASLKVGLLIAVVTYAALIGLGVALGKSAAQIKQSVPPAEAVLIWLFGLITLTFAAFERFGKTAWLSDWKPGRLPPVGGRRARRFELGFEIVANLVFLAWWFGLFHVRALVAAPWPISLDMAPVWAAWRWPIAVYAAWQIASNLVGLFRPDRPRLFSGLVIGQSLFGIAILGQVLQGGRWIVASGAQIPPAELVKLQTALDLSMRIAIIGVIVGLGVRVGLEGWRAWRAGPQRTAAVA